MWESRKMLFGENAIRRPPVAVCKTMPHVLVMYIAIYSRRAALAGSAPTHKADGRVFCVLQNCGNRHSFHRLYAIS